MSGNPVLNKLIKEICTQWVDVFTAVNKGQQLTSWLLSANCRAAVRPQMCRHESQVLYKLIFVAFDWFQILLDNRAISTIIIMTHFQLELAAKINVLTIKLLHVIINKYEKLMSYSFTSYCIPHFIC